MADPLFADPAGYNFQLKPGSPAAKIGFEPFDLSTVGPRPHPPDQGGALSHFGFPPTAMRRT